MSRFFTQNNLREKIYISICVYGRGGGEFLAVFLILSLPLQLLIALMHHTSILFNSILKLYFLCVQVHEFFLAFYYFIEISLGHHEATKVMNIPDNTITILLWRHCYPAATLIPRDPTATSLVTHPTVTPLATHPTVTSLATYPTAMRLKNLDSIQVM